MFVDGASKFPLRATKPSLPEMPLSYRDSMYLEGRDAKKSTEPMFFFSEIVPPPELDILQRVAISAALRACRACRRPPGPAVSRPVARQGTSGFRQVGVAPLEQDVEVLRGPRLRVEAVRVPADDHVLNFFAGELLQQISEVGDIGSSHMSNTEASLSSGSSPSQKSKATSSISSWLFATPPVQCLRRHSALARASTDQKSTTLVGVAHRLVSLPP
jgi:hypothetical protein